jgi:D-glycero-D-manno-heptose 1,7-bisphosphate phosphatase
MRRAVFLDRDGTIIEEVGYCSDPAMVRAYSGAAAAIQRLRDAGFLVIVVTNQGGIGNGYFTEADYHAVHREMERQLAPVQIDATYFAPDRSDVDAPRRKPNPGMVLEAARDFDIDLARSYFVGDREIDVDCGHNAGTRSVLVETGYGAQVQDCEPDHRARDLAQAVNWILADY